MKIYIIVYRGVVNKVLCDGINITPRVGVIDLDGREVGEPVEVQKVVVESVITCDCPPVQAAIRKEEICGN